MNPLTEQETDEFIMKNNGCGELECNVCFYRDDVRKKCKIGTFTPNITEIVYEHISVKINKLKLRKIREILK